MTTPGRLKVQVAGPWTLAASLELTRGDKALADPGAVRDIAESLADGAAAHVADVRRAPAAGARHRCVRRAVAARRARRARCRQRAGSARCRAPRDGWPSSDWPTVLGGIGSPGGRALLRVEIRRSACMRKAGAAVRQPRLHARAQPSRRWTNSARRSRAALGVIAGLVRTAGRGTVLSDVGRTVEPILSLWRRLGLAAEQLREVAVSPTCGLAGASPQAARAAMKRCREAGSRLAEGDL